MPRGVYDRKKSKARKLENMAIAMRKRAVTPERAVGITVNLPPGKSSIKVCGSTGRAIGTFIVDETSVSFLKSDAKVTAKKRGVMRWSTLAALFNSGINA